MQGVGFRPFIYNLARQYRLVGSVQNNSQGVLIHAQGKEDQLRSFVQSIRRLAPVAARIDAVDISSLPEVEYSDFRILSSERQDDAFTHIPPDLALCSECRRELSDPGNRRFAYPFINCINCGPRFTIIRDLPYDRPLTTMDVFLMCPDCLKEYDNPADRRFHAQPVACEKCGPILRFLISDKQKWIEQDDKETAIHLASQTLKDNKIILIQGIGGFHLACDAQDEKTVQMLRSRKRREEKPFAVMFPTIDKLMNWCDVGETELDLLSSVSAPILILSKRKECLAAKSVSPDNSTIGAMLPYSPLHHLLLREYNEPLVMTSANLCDEPIIYRTDEALRQMHSVADAALVHNREICMFNDDSVVHIVSRLPRLWRRSRGYVPEALQVPDIFKKDTLAFGPELKNTFCLGKVDYAFLSQHIGNLDSMQAEEMQRRVINHFLNLFNDGPEYKKIAAFIINYMKIYISL